MEGGHIDAGPQKKSAFILIRLIGLDAPGRGGDNACEQVLVLFVIAGKKPADGIDLLVLILKE